jgi:hypothetical protein
VKVYLVMGNDFPEAVFTTREAAEAYCDRQKDRDKAAGRRIYWRVKEFEVREL